MRKPKFVYPFCVFFDFIVYLCTLEQIQKVKNEEDNDTISVADSCAGYQGTDG